MSQKIVNIKYCCPYLKDAVEGVLNGVHITEIEKEKKFAPFYMNVETNEGILPCFLKFCPECGSKLSGHKW